VSNGWAAAKKATPANKSTSHELGGGCNTLLHTATHCTHCSTLQFPAIPCNTLPYASTHGFCEGSNPSQHINVLRVWRWAGAATHCNTLPHRAAAKAATPANTSTTQELSGGCNTLQNTATHCNTRQAIIHFA